MGNSLANNTESARRLLPFSRYTHTHAAVSQLVLLSTVKLLPVIEVLSYVLQLLTLFICSEARQVSLLTVKLPCTIKHSWVLI